MTLNAFFFVSLIFFLFTRFVVILSLPVRCAHPYLILNRVQRVLWFSFKSRSMSGAPGTPRTFSLI